MKVFILSLLTILLGVLVYIHVSLNTAKTVSTQIEKEYVTYKYTIINVDESGYHGKADNGQSIYIKKENVNVRDSFEENDRIIVYFEKEERKDGLVKIELEE